MAEAGRVGVANICGDAPFPLSRRLQEPSASSLRTGSGGKSALPRRRSMRSTRYWASAPTPEKRPEPQVCNHGSPMKYRP